MNIPTNLINTLCKYGRRVCNDTLDTCVNACSETDDELCNPDESCLRKLLEDMLEMRGGA